LQQTREAIKAYENALAVNPHLECVRRTIEQLKQT
jgi:hypothetical protein